ncbi:hypothetical protein M0804_014778 [Polistes exclamans]|nr:hypothetical protein M0804_014778 [Polistes exclamans]
MHASGVPVLRGRRQEASTLSCLWSSTVFSTTTLRSRGSVKRANITNNRNLEEEVRDQATKASIIFEYVTDIMWRNKHMSIKSKVRIYKTCVRPIMTHTAETRAESTISIRILRTTEMKTLRAITGNILRDRRRNKEIRKECEMHDVVRWLRGRRRVRIELRFLLLPNRTGISPSQQVPSNDLVILLIIQLVDPGFGKPSEIDAIIGMKIIDWEEDKRLESVQKRYMELNLDWDSNTPNYIVEKECKYERLRIKA